MMWARLRKAGAALALLLLASCQTELNAGLTERAANDEVALLLNHGIPATREEDPKTGTVTVFVAESRFADAVDLLRANGLPKQRFDSIADIFKGNGLIASPVSEQARMIYALDQETSHTVSEIDGVLDARVQIVLPDNDPLLRNAPPASASVFVRYRPGSSVPELVPQIKMLVAGGVAGLSYDRVSVVLVPAAMTEIAPQPMPMEDVYGIWVYRGSAGEVHVLLGCLAGLLAMLLAIGGRFAWAALPEPMRRAGERKALVPPLRR